MIIERLAAQAARPRLRPRHRRSPAPIRGRRSSATMAALLQRHDRVRRRHLPVHVPASEARPADRHAHLGRRRRHQRPGSADRRRRNLRAAVRDRDTPTGKYVIEGHGVDPDIVVEEDVSAQLAGKDPQLDRAIDELKKAIQANAREAAAAAGESGQGARRHACRGSFGAVSWASAHRRFEQTRRVGRGPPHVFALRPCRHRATSSSCRSGASGDVSGSRAATT